MAIDLDRIDAQARVIADLYREVETALTRRIARALASGIDSPTWAQDKLAAVGALRRSIQLIVAALGFAVGGRLRETLASAYRSGSASALADIAHELAPVSGIGRAARAAGDVVTNVEQLDALADSIVGDLRPLHARIVRDAEDVYRDVIATTTARVIAGVATRREASQAAYQALVDRGITGFVDRAGRRWQLSTYVEMAVRTVTQRAAVQGHLDQLAADGFRLVYVDDHAQECVICRPWEGQILALSGPVGDVVEEHATQDAGVHVHVKATLAEARAAGLFHPNCRHTVNLYLPGLTHIPTATEDPAGDTARQRQRALERKIRAAKMQREAALSPAAKRDANARVRAAQAQLRQHLDDNPNLKRLPYREQIGAGNLPKHDDAAGAVTVPTSPTLDGGPGSPAPHVTPADVAHDRAELMPDRSPLPGQLDLLDQPAEPVDLTALSDDELADEFSRLSRESDDMTRLEPILAEMDRRTAVALEPVQPEPVPELDPNSPEARKARREAARARNRDLERHAAIANVPATYEELVHKGASPAVIREHLDALRNGDPDVDELVDLALSSTDPADRDRITRELVARARDRGLDPMGEAGVLEPYDPARHDPIGNVPDEGAAVSVIRPGYTYTTDEHGTVTLDRSVVRLADQDEIDRVAQDRRVDDLVARGWEWREAYAEVYGLDSDELARQERAALVDSSRRHGETREQTLRRLYREWVDLTYLQAEGATNGHLLNPAGRAAGISARSLFSGPRARAAKYASDELAQWWAEHGGRRTYGEFAAEMLGRASDLKAAARARLQGRNDRDFGL